jgi:hypothetical protein
MAKSNNSADTDAEYERVSTRLKHPRTNDTKGSRSYPGYEDTSPKGRAQIKAFNEAGGPQFLNDDTDPREYRAAAQHALDARRKSGTKQEPMRGRPKKSKKEPARGRPKSLLEAVGRGVEEGSKE